MQAIVLAGGQGTRLRPFTTSIPKPLVPVGDLPILEIVLRRLQAHGVDRVVLAVNHLARLIEAFFGKGEQLGLDIKYSLEATPLGTAGPLRIIEELDEDFIVMNGDLLTTLDYRDLFRFHKDKGAAATIATYPKEVKIDLGVLETRGDVFVNYIEKPTYYFTVSTGIYVLNKRVVDYVPGERRFDMPDLMLALNAANENVVCYSGQYNWLDIGRADDYETAVELFEANRAAYLDARLPESNA